MTIQWQLGWNTGAIFSAEGENETRRGAGENARAKIKTTKRLQVLQCRCVKCEWWAYHHRWGIVGAVDRVVKKEKRKSRDGNFVANKTNSKKKKKIQCCSAFLLRQSSVCCFKILAWGLLVHKCNPARLVKSTHVELVTHTSAPAVNLCLKSRRIIIHMLFGFFLRIALVFLSPTSPLQIMRRGVPWWRAT